MVAGLIVVDELDPRTQDEEKKARPNEKLVKIKIGDLETRRNLKVGKNLPPKVRATLEAFLVKNLDVFAWMHTKMVGI